MEHIGNVLPKVDKDKTIKSSDEPVYNCPICMDFGWVHPTRPDSKPDYSQLVPCPCSIERFKVEREKRMLLQCNLPADTKGWTFENFEAYNDSLREALSIAQEIASGEGKLKWLILKGETDCGKSHLAVSICREWLIHDKPARYTFVPDMLDDLRSGYDSDAEHSFESKMQVYKTAPLLVLDDLGTEKLTDWGYEKLCIIINHRAEEGLYLVVTTNKDIRAIPGDKEHRIGSRLLRHRQGKLVEIEAPEYRLRQKT